MKKFIYIIIILLLTGCKEKQSEQLLDKVENIITTNPDSAQILLNSIPSPEKLNNKDFAHWCLLSGKLTDELYTPMLPTYQLERAYKWYSSHGKVEEQAQLLLYIGRSYVEDGDYDQGMSNYTDALEIANDNNLVNHSGYINSYMGTLYESKGLLEQAMSKYKTAAECFKEANNNDSYACALRDAGREYVRMDSLPAALKMLFKADSIASTSDNNDVKASIINTLGGVFLIQRKYEQAKASFHKALSLGKNKMPNYMGLIKIYIETDSLSKAKELLESIPHNDPEYIYSIKRLYYLIHRQERNYELALNNLEEYTYLVDSIVNAENQSKILDIEKKYNELKSLEKINHLTISKQRYIIILIVCLIIILTIAIANLLYRKKVKEKIQKQQMELKEVKIELLHLSIELDKKKVRLSSLEEKDENYKKMEDEIAGIISNYKKLQNKIITDAPIYKNLVSLANQHIPGNDKPLITEKLWKQIVDEITSIYPNLYSYILDQSLDLTDQEWQYCCFCMLGFDTNSEAKLLNINLTSARTKRHRLKKKLNVPVSAKVPLHEYIAEKLIQ